VKPAVRYLRSISYLLTAAGLAMIAGAALLDFRDMWTIAGMMLVVAGIVKIVMVHLWVNVAGIGSVRPSGDDS
jgi:hypothetical protein